MKFMEQACIPLPIRTAAADAALAYAEALIQLGVAKRTKATTPAELVEFNYALAEAESLVKMRHDDLTTLCIPVARAYCKAI